MEFSFYVVKILLTNTVKYTTSRVHIIDCQSVVPPLCSYLSLHMPLGNDIVGGSNKVKKCADIIYR